jgi:hypothetical protein
MVLIPPGVIKMARTIRLATNEISAQEITLYRRTKRLPEDQKNERGHLKDTNEDSLLNDLL